MGNKELFAEWRHRQKLYTKYYQVARRTIQKPWKKDGLTSKESYKMFLGTYVPYRKCIRSVVDLLRGVVFKQLSLKFHVDWSERVVDDINKIITGHETEGCKFTTSCEGQHVNADDDKNKNENKNENVSGRAGENTDITTKDDRDDTATPDGIVMHVVKSDGGIATNA